MDPNGLCNIFINLNFNGNLNSAQQTAMRNEISRIFRTANQNVVFVNSSNGADYSLNVGAIAPPTYGGVPLASTAGGGTGLNGGVVEPLGFGYVDGSTSFLR